MSATRRPNNPSLADITAKTKPVEKIVKMCVDGELLAQHEMLDEELEERQYAQQDRPRNKLNPEQEEDPEIERLAFAIDAVEAKMKKATYEFRFRKLPGTEWDDMIAAHEPRKGNTADANTGVDMSRFPKAAVAKSLVEPEVTADAFDEFWAKLNAGQRDLLFQNGARAANRSGVLIPKSGRASDVINRSRRKSATA